jgi:hypothetical protein
MWVDWVEMAFIYQSGKAKGLNYEEEMRKLEELRRVQVVESLL